MKPKYLILVLAVLGVAVLATRSFGEPAGWSVEAVHKAVIAGSSTVQTVSYTPAGAISGEPEVVVSPELTSYLTAEIGESGGEGFAPGETPILVTLTFAPSVATSPTVISGMVRIRTGGIPAFSKPLTVGLEVEWPTLSNPQADFEMEYPPFLVPNPLDASTVNGVTAQHVFFEEPFTRRAFTVDWHDNYPTGLHIVEWADEGTWPFPDNDWRNVYKPVVIGGIDMLQMHNPDTGSVIFAVGDKLYHVLNGIGIDPVYIDRDAFQDIIESINFK